MKHSLIPIAPPELLSPLRTLDQVRAFQTESGVGGSLPEVLTDPLGYFLFRYFVESYGDPIVGMTFLEDVVQFKMTAAAGSRAAL